MADESDKKPNVTIFSVADCTIQSVVVYLDRAEICRVVKVAVSAGENEVILNDLSAHIDADSIRVEGEGSATIVEVVFEKRHLPVESASTQSSSSVARDLRLVMAQTQEKLTRLTVKEARLRKQRNMLDTIVTSVNAGKDAPTGAAVDAIVSLLEMYNTQAERLDNLLADLEAEMKVMRDEIESLSRNLRELNHPPSKQERQLSVLLEAEEDSQINLVVSYVVSQASWLPKYDIRVFSKDGLMKIQYYGVIKQSTGEDWNNVRLNLSTAMPSVGGNVPQLDTKTLQFKRQLVEMKKAKRKFPGVSFGQQNVRMMAMSSEGRGDVLYGAPAPPEMAELQVATTEVREGIVSTMYEISRLATIPSDNVGHKVAVTIIDLTPQFEHETVPQIAAHAYVTAKVCNTSSYALLAGPSNIFLDNNFIAKATLKAVSPSEEFHCSVGVDPAVKITYKPVNKFREQMGLITKSVVLTYKQEIEVKNTRQDTINILVTDQLPRSTEEKIRVTLLEPNVKGGGKNTEAPVASLNAQNNVEWRLKVEAGVSRQLVLRYTVEHPVSEEVV